MKKRQLVFEPSPQERRLAEMLRRSVARMESRKASSLPCERFALRVFGVFDPSSARVVASFPDQYHARMFVRFSRKPLFIYCFDFVQPLPQSLY